MLDFLKDILNKFFDAVKLNEILTWSKEFFLFFIKPKLFFKTFYGRPYLKQVYQIAYYVLLFIINLTFFTNNNEIQFSNDSIKLVLSLIITYFPISLITFVSMKILRIKELNLWYPFSFVLVANLIVQNVGLFLNYLFIKNEDFTLLFLQHLIAAFGYIFCVIGFWLVYSFKFSRTIKGVLLNLLLFNLLPYVFGLINSSC